MNSREINNTKKEQWLLAIMDKRLTEQIKEFKSPQTKVLVTVLILAVICLYGKGVYNENQIRNKCETDAVKAENKIVLLQRTVDSMNQKNIERSYEDRKEFKLYIAQQDSVIERLQNALNDLK